MKIKKVLMVLILITSSLMIGCSNSISSEDKAIDSVVIDEDAKETANSNNIINITKVATTENFSSNNGVILRDDEKLIKIKYSEDFGEGEGTIYQSQFPELYIDSFAVGTITEEVVNNKNIVNWENKQTNGQLLIGYMGTEETFRILKDNKVYMLDKNYNYKEITAYKKIIEDNKRNINRFESSYDGNLDIYYFGEDKGIEKIEIIDTIEDKYYEIYTSMIGNIENKRVEISTIEDDKIYIALVDSTNEAPSILGYIENNKLTTFFDEKSEIKIKVKGDVLYSNNKILFSGYVEDNYGIWSYNIESKTLEKQIQLEYDLSSFKLSKDKSFIIITSTNSNGAYSTTLGRVTEDFKISNIQHLTGSIINISKGKASIVTGWSNNENKFLVKTVESKSVDSGEYLEDVYYEIYEVK